MDWPCLHIGDNAMTVICDQQLRPQPSSGKLERSQTGCITTCLTSPSLLHHLPICFLACPIPLLRAMATEVEEQAVTWLLIPYEPLDGLHDVGTGAQEVRLVLVVPQHHNATLREPKLGLKAILYTLHIIDAAVKGVGRSWVRTANQEGLLATSGGAKGVGAVHGAWQSGRGHSRLLWVVTVLLLLVLLWWQAARVRWLATA